MDDFKDMGEKIKDQKLCEIIPPDRSFIVRIIGSFKEFKKYNIDDQLCMAMIKIMLSVILKFKVVIAYTYSGEISLIISACAPTELASEMRDAKSSHLYGGDVFKICSAIASFCSVVFYKYINVDEQALSEYHGVPCFATEIYMIPLDDEAFVIEYIKYKSMECTQHYIMKLCRQYYTHHELYKKNHDDRVQMLTKKGINWDDQSKMLKYGCYGKKDVHKTRDENGDTIKKNIVSNHYIFKLDDLSNDEILDVINASYWSDCMEILKEVKAHTIMYM